MRSLEERPPHPTRGLMETMSDVPKIVQDRLQAAMARDAHPDADLLTAFAERALSGTEREDIVRHLARCGDCREAVALSIPPLETVSTQAEDAAGAPAHQPTETSRSWFAWPTLRWAAMAAGVAVVASVVMLRPGRQPNSTATDESRMAENKVAAPPAGSKVDATFDAKRDAKANPVAPPVKLPSSLASGSPARPVRSAVDQSLRADRDEFGSEHEHTRAARGSVASLADQGTDSPGTKRFFYQDKKLSPQPLAPTPFTANSGNAADSINGSRATVGGSRETVEVSAEAAQIQSVPAEEKLMARAEPQAISIEKAKPAAKADAATQAQNNEAASAPANFAIGHLQAESVTALQKSRASRSKDVPAQWSLASGKLQRSQDAGSTWQVALQLQHALLAVGNRGSDVWVGGEAGTLFHSSDNGATWTMLQPSTKAAALTTDIVAIEIRGPAEIVLSTGNHESWVTVDNGKTWEKK
jgi:hypothetical protein